MKPPARCPWLFDTAFAHRGLWLKNGPPENSMAAFEAASAAGLGIELDVRLTADGQPVIFHDGTLDRMTDAQGPIGARTWEELRGVTLKGGGAIPNLIDVLAKFPRMPILMEMKVSPGAEGPQEARCAALLADYPGIAAVMSFNARALAVFAAAAPHIARGQLTTGFKMPPSAPAALLPRSDDAGAEISKPDFLSCNIDALADYGAPAAARLSLPVITWTVRTEAQLKTARAHAGNWIFEALPVADVALTR